MGHLLSVWENGICGGRFLLGGTQVVRTGFPRGGTFFEGGRITLFTVCVDRGDTISSLLQGHASGKIKTLAAFFMIRYIRGLISVTHVSAPQN